MPQFTMQDLTGALISLAVVIITAVIIPTIKQLGNRAANYFDSKVTVEDQIRIKNAISVAVKAAEQNGYVEHLSGQDKKKLATDFIKSLDLKINGQPISDEVIDKAIESIVNEMKKGG